MIEIARNLWDESDEFVLRFITTNGAVRSDGACVMGRGCALEAVERHPGVNYTLGRYIKASGNRVHQLLPTLASFPVKHHWRDDADLRLIQCSAHQAVALLNRREIEHAWLPRPGCGNGRLKWADVKPVIAPILDDRFEVVTFPTHTSQGG